MSILILLLLILALGAFAILRRVEIRVSSLEERLNALERGLASPAEMPASDAAVVAIAEAVVADAQAEEPVPDGESASAVAEIPSEAAIESAAVQAPEPRPRESIESMIGARWPVWVGGLALALGGIFLVKYSIESGLISPAIRLAIAALFGLLLLAAGEGVRRSQKSLDLPAIRHALVPGALTAAGCVTLFGAAYAAYGFYTYIAAPTAFALLAVISLATVALSLLHGQALAGLGLLAAMVTPALIDVDAPSLWGLFGYLSVSWVATVAASRFRGWNVVPALANLFMLGWTAFVFLDGRNDHWAIVASQIVVAMGLAFIWPAGDAADASTSGAERDGWRLWYRETAQSLPHRLLRWTGAFAIFAAAAAFVTFGASAENTLVDLQKAAVIVAAAGFWGAWRRGGLSVPFFSLAGIVAVAFAVGGDALINGWDPLQDAVSGPNGARLGGLFSTISLLAAAFWLLGIVAMLRHGSRRPAYSAIWGFVMGLAPLILLTSSFLNFGNFRFDAAHGAAALLFAVLLLAVAEWVARKAIGGVWQSLHIGALAAGSFLMLVLALHALTQSVVTTILIAVAGFIYLMAVRVRPWPILPWILGLAGVVVLARIGWQPSLVGDMELSKTPFFNQLLPGYGIPALLMALGAYAVKDSPDMRLRNLLQALASLLALMTVAILVRHAMNGGVLSHTLPTLGEQSIYTLLAVGGSAVLMTLDMRSPSPVFRWGSMLVGTLSMLLALGAHLFTLNPYFSGELTGRYPFFNLLLLGYLLPSLAFFGLAYYARGKRPKTYVSGLAAAGAILVFVWVTLSVRRYWQGPGIADWKGFQQGEMYTYSVVWLILGVLLLAAGSRFHAKSLRLASAFLVLVAVLKVFLVDMSNLEGMLRALSFIGLGVVLIGIGLFYQRILGRTKGDPKGGLPAGEGSDTAA